MKVKKFMAPTMPEVMSKVKKELGNDVVILNSKVVFTGGFLGLFKKKNIEVVAAIEPEPVKPKQRRVNATTESYDKRNDLNAFIKEESTAPSAKEQQVVLEELRSLRKWIETKAEDEQAYPVAYQSAYVDFIKRGLDEAVVTGWIEELIADSSSDHNLVFSEAKKNIEVKINDLFTRSNSGNITFNNKFIHLVGPTGVGKTTTIAKLAAKSLLKDRKKVALITTDTYRIAAIEQLKTYAKILDIPIEIAYSIEDYQKARLKFQSYDLVFVDTAGRNFTDSKYVKELGRVVDLSRDIETYLVLSLTTKHEDLVSIYEQFEPIPLSGFIFTKKDETSSFGSIVNLVKKSNLGVAYVTTGQDVPDDIKPALPHYLTGLIMEQKIDE